MGPTRPGAAAPRRAPDRRGVRLPAVRGGAVLVHPARGRAARVRVPRAGHAGRQLLLARRARVPRLHGAHSAATPAGSRRRGEWGGWGGTGGINVTSEIGTPG